MGSNTQCPKCSPIDLLPWEAKGRNAGWIYDAKGTAILHFGGSWHGQDPRERTEANAAFIVHAVNTHDALVEALERLVDDVESALGSPGGVHHLTRQARQALSQASKEAPTDG